MKKEALRKLLTTIPGLTILYGLPFGLSMYIVQGPSHSSPFGSFVSGVVFGLAMAFITHKKNLKNLEDASSLKSKRSITFDTYLKNGTVPDTEAETTKLKTYMTFLETHQQNLQARYYPKKYSKFGTYLMLAAFFILTLFALENLRWLAIIYPLAVGIGLYGEYKQKILKKQIDSMRQKIDRKQKTKRS